jgi:hypothetical protein
MRYRTNATNLILITQTISHRLSHSHLLLGVRRIGDLNNAARAALAPLLGDDDAAVDRDGNVDDVTRPVYVTTINTMDWNAASLDSEMVGWGGDRHVMGAADALDSGEGRGIAGAMTTSKRSVGSGGQGGDNDDNVDPRGDDYKDTTISLAMATATRVAGDKECDGDGGKSDGGDEKGCGRATATAPKRAVAAAATRVAGDKEGDGEGGESDGDAYEQSDGGGNDPSTQEHPQLRAKKTTMTMTARRYHRNDNSRRGSHKPGGIVVSL